MKKLNVKAGRLRTWFLTVSATGLLLIAGGCRQSTRSAGEMSMPPVGKIHIAATRGVMSDSDYKTYAAGRITAAQRKELQIDSITTVELNLQPNKELALGKTVYADENVGKLITLLHIIEDHGTHEYLISYDAQNRFTDCINIGQAMYYSGDEGAATIEGNAVLCSSSWSEPGEGSRGISTIYTITDDLHFARFALPAASYPCAVPFMAYESEEAPLLWDIESVVCTGVSGGTWKFTVRGKGAADSRKESAENRNVRLEPTQWGWDPVADAIQAAFPAVDSGESFETEISIPQKALDGKPFYAFHIKK
ncbi:MAG: hypothetical protein LBJ01_09535 [Tannerella sp.]|jgi:hypothetical protein|nr:hypothetical protein [Tannerella sp.]